MAVVTAVSITTLFLRGFTFKDLNPNNHFQTPSMEIWLLQSSDYDTKMEAYQAGISSQKEQWGIYVISNQGHWHWIAGVYTTEDDAMQALQQPQTPNNVSVKSCQITGKQFQLSDDAAIVCQDAITAIQDIFTKLIELRSLVTKSANTSNILLDLINHYNQIKDFAAQLQRINADLQNSIVATVIYSINQNLLGLHDIVCEELNQPCSLAEINTALLMTIFSLDNF